MTAHLPQRFFAQPNPCRKPKLLGSNSCSKLPGFAILVLARRHTPPKQVRHPSRLRSGQALRTGGSPPVTPHPATPTNARRHARARLGRTYYPASLHRSRCQTVNTLSPKPRRSGSGTGRSLVAVQYSRMKNVCIGLIEISPAPTMKLNRHPDFDPKQQTDNLPKGAHHVRTNKLYPLV
jgi:hypothetical protein